jgi:Aerotolerance regulator N-terminal
MFGLPLAFAAPAVLAALVGLVALYFLLRVTPPSPRRAVFPPLRLLVGISTIDRRRLAETGWRSRLDRRDRSASPGQASDGGSARKSESLSSLPAGYVFVIEGDPIASARSFRAQTMRRAMPVRCPPTRARS